MKTVTISGYRGEDISVPVFPVGSSALMCKCGTVATIEQEVQAVLYHFYLCENCDERVMLGRNSGIREDALPCFNDEVVLNSVWWHATTKENWYDGLLSNKDIPMVHLGTRRAAISRVFIMGRGKYSTGTDWALYQVKLHPAMKIATRVVDDFNGDAPETVTQATQNPFFEPQGATRYLNRYEAVGSISLLANPLFFDIVDAEPFVLEEKSLLGMI